METDKPQKSSLLAIIAQTASLWILADIGYYVFLPAFGHDAGYNNTPIPITIYYLVWTLIAIFVSKTN